MKIKWRISGKDNPRVTTVADSCPEHCSTFEEFVKKVQSDIQFDFNETVKPEIETDLAAIWKKINGDKSVRELRKTADDANHLSMDKFLVELDKAVLRAGGARKLALKINVHQYTIWRWKRDRKGIGRANMQRVYSLLKKV